MRFVITDRGVLECSNISLTLTRDNHLFGFDKLALSRSVTFEVPRTTNNNKLFGYADIHGTGTAERVAYEAQLQADSVAIDGVLHLTSVTPTAFRLLFVFGELSALSALKDVQVENVITRGEYVAQYNTDIVAANGQDLPLWGNVQYRTWGGQQVNPSFNLSEVLRDVLSRLDMNNTLPITSERVIVGKPTGEASIVGDIKSTLDGNPTTLTLTNLGAYIVAGVPHVVADEYQTLEQDIYHNDYVVGVVSTYGAEYEIPTLKALTAISLEFPASFPLITMSYIAQGEMGRTTRIVSGETIDIEAGSTFWFNVGTLSEQETDRGETYYSGQTLVAYNKEWNFTSYDSEFNESVTLKVGEDLTAGTDMDFKDNVSGSLMEWLRVFATLQGKVLDYDTQNGLTLNALNTNEWERVTLTDIIARGEMVRTFADFTRRNVVRFGDDEVPQKLKVEQVYEIGNGNISNEANVLREMALSEGVSQLDGHGSQVLRVLGEMDTIGDCSSPPDMVRVELPRNTGLDNLCAVSTRVVVSVKMPLRDFLNLKTNNTIAVDGIVGVWTNATWTGDIATITLQKV